MQAAHPPTPTPYKTLTQAQVDSFWTNGYLPIGKILNDEEIELLRQEYDHEFARARAGETSFRNLSINNTDDLEAKNKAEKQMLQIMQMCERNIHFRKLTYNERILDVIEDLLGPNIQLFHDQALYKPANAIWVPAPPSTARHNEPQSMWLWEGQELICAVIHRGMRRQWTYTIVDLNPQNAVLVDPNGVHTDRLPLHAPAGQAAGMPLRSGLQERGHNVQAAPPAAGGVAAHVQ